MTSRDRAVIFVLVFFIVVAWTIELYWVIFAHDLVARADYDWLARGFAFYGQADRSYFAHIDELSMGLESIHTFVTAPLCLWLIHAIRARRPERHPLQLALASAIAYGTILYFWTAYLGRMHEQTLANIAIMGSINAPWLLGALFLGADSWQAITARFRAGD